GDVSFFFKKTSGKKIICLKKISNKCILPILNFKNMTILKGHVLFSDFFLYKHPKKRLTIKCNTIYAGFYFNTFFSKKNLMQPFAGFLKNFRKILFNIKKYIYLQSTRLFYQNEVLYVQYLV